MVPALSVCKSVFCRAILNFLSASPFPTFFGTSGHQSSNSALMDFDFDEDSFSCRSFFSVSGLFCRARGVSISFSETVSRRFRNRFTRSVETSLLYCRLFQLCGSIPVSVTSNKPNSLIYISNSDVSGSDKRSANAVSARHGRAPLLRLAKHKRLTHFLKISAGNCWTFGSSSTSS